MTARVPGIRMRFAMSLMALLVPLAALPAAASAGSYLVAQCSAGLYRPSPDAVFGRSTTHYISNQNCNEGQPGLQIDHTLLGETGTLPDRYGRWAWRAPAGTYLTGGNIYAHLRNDDSNVASLTVTADSGPAHPFAVGTADGLTGPFSIPLGNWRSFVASLSCNAPGDNRCGAGPGAQVAIKQVRLQLTDASPPALTSGGTMLAGGELRGPQSVEVAGTDQGAGIHRAEIDVNGIPVVNDVSPCNPLPGGFSSRLRPCDSTLTKTYSVDTAVPPFRNGENAVRVCVFDYAQAGVANSDCDSHTVLINNLCPGSDVGGGRSVTASFDGNRRQLRRARYGSRAKISGAVTDGSGHPVPGATVCVQVRTRLTGAPYHLLGTAKTNSTGQWSYTVPRGSSRQIRAGYRDASYETGTELSLLVQTRATFHLSRNQTRAGRKISFRGRIPGPTPGRRVVVIHGTVPGAGRQFLIRRARTNGLGRFRVGYRFAPVSGSTKFVFWAEVPVQDGYPYIRGRSSNRYVRVRP